MNQTFVNKVEHINMFASNELNKLQAMFISDPGANEKIQRHTETDSAICQDDSKFEYVWCRSIQTQTNMSDKIPNLDQIPNIFGYMVLDVHSLTI